MKALSMHGSRSGVARNVPVVPEDGDTRVGRYRMKDSEKSLGTGPSNHEGRSED